MPSRILIIEDDRSISDLLEQNLREAGYLVETARDGETGLLFPPGDAAALAERLERLVEEPELLPRLRDTVTRQPAVSREAHVDEMEAIYRELLSR